MEDLGVMFLNTKTLANRPDDGSTKTPIKADDSDE